MPSVSTFKRRSVIIPVTESVGTWNCRPFSFLSSSCVYNNNIWQSRLFLRLVVEFALWTQNLTVLGLFYLLEMKFILIRTFSIRVAKSCQKTQKSALRKCTFVSALIVSQTWNFKFSNCTLFSVHFTGHLDTISWTDDGQLLAVSTQLGKDDYIVNWERKQNLQQSGCVDNWLIVIAYTCFIYSYLYSFVLYRYIMNSEDD